MFAGTVVVRTDPLRAIVANKGILLLSRMFIRVWGASSDITMICVCNSIFYFPGSGHREESVYLVFAAATLTLQPLMHYNACVLY